MLIDLYMTEEERKSFSNADDLAKKEHGSFVLDKRQMPDNLIGYEPEVLFRGADALEDYFSRNTIETFTVGTKHDSYDPVPARDIRISPETGMMNLGGQMFPVSETLLLNPSFCALTGHVPSNWRKWSAEEIPEKIASLNYSFEMSGNPKEICFVVRGGFGQAGESNVPMVVGICGKHHRITCEDFMLDTLRSNIPADMRFNDAMFTPSRFTANIVSKEPVYKAESQDLKVGDQFAYFQFRMGNLTGYRNRFTKGLLQLACTNMGALPEDLGECSIPRYGESMDLLEVVIPQILVSMHRQVHERARVLPHLHKHNLDSEFLHEDFSPELQKCIGKRDGEEAIEIYEDRILKENGSYDYGSFYYDFSYCARRHSDRGKREKLTRLSGQIFEMFEKRFLN